MVDALGAALDGARLPALVVSDLALPGAPDVYVIRPHEPKPEVMFRTVIVVAGDVVALRDLISRIGEVGYAREVGVVALQADRAITHRHHPSWPELSSIDARLVGEAAVTRLELASRASAREVLLALAEGAGLVLPPGPGGFRVARARAEMLDAKVPPDAVVSEPGIAPVELLESPITGRVPMLLTDDDGPGPLDEGALSPIGFSATWTTGMVAVDGVLVPTPRQVSGLRHAQGVLLPDDADPRVQAAYALAGVPLIREDDPVERLRATRTAWRAAVRSHGTIAWRARWAEASQVRFDPGPQWELLEQRCAAVWAEAAAELGAELDPA